MKNIYLAVLLVGSLLLVNGFTYYITQNSITDLKTETQQKIDKLQSDNTNIQQKIEEIILDNKNISIKIDEIKIENNNLKSELNDTQSQLFSLKNDVKDLEKEVSSHWITIRNYTGSGGYGDIGEAPVDWIKLNSTDVQISWSFKELSNSSIGSQFSFGLHGSGTTIAGYSAPFLLEGSGTLIHNNVVAGPYYLVIRGTNSTRWNVVVKYWSGN